MILLFFNLFFYSNFIHQLKLLFDFPFPLHLLSIFFLLVRQGDDNRISGYTDMKRHGLSNKLCE